MTVRFPQPDATPEPTRRQLPAGHLVDEAEIGGLRAHQRPAGELVTAATQHDGGVRDPGSHISQTITIRGTHR